MKRKILILVTMLMSVILLSSVSAVPNIKIKPDNDPNILLNNIDFTILKRLTNRLIDIVGFDIYNKTHNSIEILFYEQIENIDIGDKLPMYYFNWLVDITVTLILITMVFIGHSEIAHVISILLSATLIFIPCFIVTFFSAIPETLTLLLDDLDILEDFFYEYGIIGICLLLILAIPIIIILTALIYPIMVITSGLELWYSVIIEAYDRTMQYKGSIE